MLVPLRRKLIAAALATGCSSPTGQNGSSSLHVAWHVPSSAGPANSWTAGRPALLAGRLFVEDGFNVLALDAATGSTRWTHRVRIAPQPAVRALVATNGLVLVAEVDSIFALDASDGHTVWSTHPDSAVAEASPATDGSSFFTAERGVPRISSHALAGGASRWSTNVGAGYQFPAFVNGITVTGDTLYATLQRWLNVNGALVSGVLVALDRVTGRELWRYETPAAEPHHGFVNSPGVTDRNILVADYEGAAVVAVDRVTHQPAWQRPLPGNGPLPSLLSGTTFYVGGSAGAVFAIDAATGAVRWRQENGSFISGLAVCGTSLMVNNFDIRALALTTGAPSRTVGPTGQGNIFTSNLASDGARVYVTGSDGITAVDCP